MRTQIVFIVDKSGSMFPLTKDTIGGYNSFLNGQKNKENPARITTVLFDTDYRILNKAIDINIAPELTEYVYKADGMTALLDAIGKTLTLLRTEMRATDKKIVVIITDGQENSSIEYTRDTIKQMIKERQSDGWTFLFLGANIDAFTEASNLGIHSMHTAQYSGTGVGTRSVYDTLNMTVTNYRASGTVDPDWKESVE